jgi:hypothetical protein
MSGNCEKPEGIQAFLFIFSNAETMKRCKSKVAKTAVVYVSYNHYRSFSLQANEISPGRVFEFFVCKLFANAKGPLS